MVFKIKRFELSLFAPMTIFRCGWFKPHGNIRFFKVPHGITGIFQIYVFLPVPIKFFDGIMYFCIKAK